MTKRTWTYACAILFAIAPCTVALGAQQWEGDQLANPKKPVVIKHKARIFGFRRVATPPRAVPALLGTNYGMAPPGAVLTISGTNFSPDVREDQVLFNGQPAQVTAASPNTLSVIVPEWPYGSSQLGISINVVVRGVPSANRLSFDIGAKYLSPNQL